MEGRLGGVRGDIAFGSVCVLSARLIFLPAANEGADEAGIMEVQDLPALFSLSSCTDESRSVGC